MTFLVRTLSVLAVVLVLDGIWLGLVMRDVYREQLGGLLRSPILWPAAGAFYAILSVGLVAFVLPKADASGVAWSALWWGALFGFVAYATYDLTNLATMKGFPPLLAAIDLAWGTTVCALSSMTGWLIARALGW